MLNMSAEERFLTMKKEYLKTSQLMGQATMIIPTTTFVIRFMKLSKNIREISCGVCAFIYRVMEQTAVIVFFTGRASELSVNKMYKLAESQDVIQSLTRHAIKSSALKGLVARFVKDQAKASSPVKRSIQRIKLEKCAENSK